jgi:hypothetical protein
MSILTSIFNASSAQPTTLFNNNKSADSTPVADPAKKDSAFGPSTLLDISSEANNAAAAASKAADAAKKKEGEEALLSLIQQLLTSVQDYLQNIGEDNPQTTEVSAISSNDNTNSNALAGLSGPVSNAQVEDFLGRVEDQPNISAEQKKQVRDMMEQYKNVPTTSAMLESIQATLASSGILPIA